MFISAQKNHSIFNKQVSDLKADYDFGVKTYFIESLSTYNDLKGLEKEKNLKKLDFEQFEIENFQENEYSIETDTVPEYRRNSMYPFSKDSSTNLGSINNFNQKEKNTSTSNFENEIIKINDSEVLNLKNYKMEEEIRIFDDEKIVEEKVEENEKLKEVEFKGHKFIPKNNNLKVQEMLMDRRVSSSLLPDINPNSWQSKMRSMSISVSDQGEDRVKGIIALMFAEKLISNDAQRGNEFLDGMKKALSIENSSTLLSSNNGFIFKEEPKLTLKENLIVEEEEEVMEKVNKVEINIQKISEDNPVNVVESVNLTTKNSRTSGVLKKMKKGVRGLAAFKLLNTVKVTNSSLTVGEEEFQIEVESANVEDNVNEETEEEINYIEQEDEETVNYPKARPITPLEKIDVKKNDFYRRRRNIKIWE
ncbi:hypothetical protein HK099_007047, partial [Clydaea vesicula]